MTCACVRARVRVCVCVCVIGWRLNEEVSKIRVVLKWKKCVIFHNISIFLMNQNERTNNLLKSMVFIGLMVLSK